MLENCLKSRRQMSERDGGVKRGDVQLVVSEEVLMVDFVECLS